MVLRSALVMDPILPGGSLLSGFERMRRLTMGRTAKTAHASSGVRIPLCITPENAHSGNRKVAMDRIAATIMEKCVIRLAVACAARRSSSGGELSADELDIARGVYWGGRLGSRASRSADRQYHLTAALIGG